MSAPSSPVIAVVFMLLAACVPALPGQAQLTQSPTRLSDAGYTRLLDHLQVDLGAWEAVFQKIDPGRGNASYEEGKNIDIDRNAGLIQISNMRITIGQERQHRSLHGEIALGIFLAELNTDFYALSSQGALNDVSVEAVGGYGAEVGAMKKKFTEDGMSRLKALEASACTGGTE